MSDDRFMSVDTALSTEGYFPLSQGDVIVEILTPYDWQIVVVSDRYTAADIAEAAEIAVDAYHEREGHEVPWTAMGAPFYHVQAYRRSHQREPAHHGIVRMDSDNGDWAFEEDTRHQELAAAEAALVTAMEIARKTPDMVITEHDPVWQRVVRAREALD